MDNLFIVIIAILTVAILVMGYLLIRASVDNLDTRHAVALAKSEEKFVSMRTDRDNNRRMALQATIILENRVNTERKERGLAPFPVIAAVLREHNSPVTAEQSDAANFATIRARVTAAALELGEDVPEVGQDKYS